jgi:hypothetical protein
VRATELSIYKYSILRKKSNFNPCGTKRSNSNLCGTRSSSSNPRGTRSRVLTPLGLGGVWLGGKLYPSRTPHQITAWTGFLIPTHVPTPLHWALVLSSSPLFLMHLYALILSSPNRSMYLVNLH